jgi:putative transposase
VFTSLSKFSINGGRIGGMRNAASAHSLEGWSAVMGLRRSGEKSLTDERILGSNDFVQRMFGEADHRKRHLFSSVLRGRQAQQIIARSCEKEGISIQELQRASRRGPIPRVQSYLVWTPARELGMPLAEIRRRLGVSPPTISQFPHGKQIC